MVSSKNLKENKTVDEFLQTLQLNEFNEIVSSLSECKTRSIEISVLNTSQLDILQ